MRKASLPQLKKLSPRHLVLYLLLLGQVFSHAQTDLAAGTDWQRIDYNGTYQDFKVPNDFLGVIYFRMFGGDGGFAKAQADGTCTGKGGSGAEIYQELVVGNRPNEIPPGSTIRFIVGQRGDNHGTNGGCVICDRYGGGGGGTGILVKIEDEWTILSVAGGGGGGFAKVFNGFCAGVTENGTSASTSEDGIDGPYSGADGGTDGHGGGGGRNVDLESYSTSGGGGGVKSAGYDNEEDNDAGQAGWENYPDGEPTGGARGSSSTKGGFGFGGGGGGGFGGGGGGGYSGGGGGKDEGAGGGGGSWINQDYSIDHYILANPPTSDSKNGYVQYRLEYKCFIEIANVTVDEPENCASQGATVIATLDRTLPCATDLTYDLYDISNPDDRRIVDLSYDGVFENVAYGEFAIVVGNIPYGPMDTATFVVNAIGDIEDPIARCKDITVTLNEDGTYGLTPDEVDNNSTDDCGIDFYSLLVDETSVSEQILTCEAVGDPNFTVGLVVTDYASQASICLAKVTVLDGTPPVLPDDLAITVYLDANGEYALQLEDINQFATTDICDDLANLVYTMDFASAQYNCSDIGQAVTHELTVTDAAGNTDIGTLSVTVLDHISPTIICQDVTIDLSDQGTATINHLDFILSADDNCMSEAEIISGYSWDPSILPQIVDCSHIGDHDIALLTSPVGYESNLPACEARLSIRDGGAPIISCRDTTIYLDQGNSGFTLETLPIESVSDACHPNSSLSITWKNTQDFFCSDIGSDEDAWIEVKDPDDNVGRCTFTVTVVDTTTAVVTCRDRNINLTEGNNFAYTLRPEEVFTGLTSLCNTVEDRPGVLSFSGDSDPVLDCDDLGNTQTLTLIYTPDDGSPASSCASTITVREEIAPQLSCPSGIIDLEATYEDCGALYEYEYTAWDEGCPEIDVTLLEGLPSGSTFPVGWNDVRIQAKDRAGNATICAFVVRVAYPSIAPTVECPQDYTITIGDQACDAIIDTSAVFHYDACSFVENTQFRGPNMASSFEPGTYNFGFRSSNTATNQSSQCTFNVTVAGGSTGPVALCKDTTVTLTSNRITLDPDYFDDGSYGPCVDLSVRFITPQTFNCSDLGSQTVSLLVRDKDFVSSTCEATLTLVPKDPDCQDITVSLDESGVVNMVPEDIFVPDGVCGNQATLTLDQTEFDCTQLGNNIVTLTRTIAEHVQQCTANVTVVAPTPDISCQDLSVRLGESGHVSIPPAVVFTGSDICGIYDLSLDKTEFTCSDIGETIVTLTATDPNNNTSTCQATISVSGEVIPEALCKETTVQLDPNGLASINVNDIDNGSNADCGLANLSLDINSFDCSTVGENIVTLTVTDLNGTAGNCIATVTVLDEVAPTAVCQDITVQLDENGLGSISTADIDNGSSDACGIATLSLDQTDFSCADVGSNTVTLSITDNNENSNSCQATVTIEDVTAPTALCQDITVQLDENGLSTITVEDLDNGSSDACGIAALSLNQTNFSCADVGSNTVTLSATDNNQNSSTCQAIVTIEDVTAPTAFCQDITVQLDENGLATITVEDLDNGSSDACGIATLSLDQTNFSCAEVGSNTVTLSMTDNNENLNSCQATVTVMDGVAAQTLCQDHTVQLDENGLVSITVNDIDNGSSDACGLANLSLSQSNFSCKEVGENTVTLTATDINGNVGTCQATVTVEDVTAPNISCQNVTIQLYENGLANISTSDIDQGTSDACGLADLSLSQSNFSCAEVGENTVRLTATDVNGNANSCQATVTIEDLTAPTALCQDITVQLDENGLAAISEADIDNGSADACGIATMSLDQTNFSCEEVGENTVNLTATDVNGNASSCQAIVTIEDATAPLVLCQDITVQLDENGLASISEADIDNGSNDACGLANLSLSQSSFSCDEVGENTVTLTATDINDNSASCQATVTIEDNIAPSALCQDITLDLNPDGLVSISGADIDNGSTDNCGIASLVASHNSFSRTEIGTNIVELTVTDPTENSSTCSATVTINPAVITFVWDDQDGDGKQDGGEPALADAKVELIDHSTGSVLQELLTNSAGEAIFSVGDVDPDQRLRLKFYEKTDHRLGLKDQGSNDNIDSDPSRSTGLTAAFTLDADGLTDKWDAALWGPGSVQAFVWDDQDGDGKQDAGEPGLSGAQVELLESNGEFIASTTTNADGLAFFNNVPADRAVRLKFYELPNLRLTLKDQGSNDNIDSDASRSTGLTGTFQATRGSQVFDSWDAGMLSAATVKAFVWDDQDGDGKQDAGEPAIAEARVDLLETDGTLIETAQTDDSGFATFENVPSDRAVKLQFFEKANHRFTLKDQGSNDNIDSDASRSTGLTASFQATTGNQVIEQWDAGLWAPGQVQAFVWDDRDGDGKQDADEPGIKGVEVHLLENDDEMLQSAYSDDTGVVTFTDVPANRPVKLQFVELGDFRFTLKDQGSNDNIDSDASRSTGMTGTFQATSGSQIINSWDAGLWSPGQVQAFVWDDLDGDGKQDAGEPGLVNVQVNLLEQGGTLISTTSTNAEGIASFNNVPADRYVKLQFFEPADQRFTLKDQGNNDNIDSDASRSNGITGAFQASKGAQVHEQVDCGLWSQGEVEAFVWNDLDGDGKQDEGEPGIEGVMVELLESNNDLIISSSTDENGLAVFFDVPADRAVKLRFQAPTGYSITARDQGNNDQIDSDAKPSNGLTGTFQATMGQELFTSWDAGMVAINTARVVPQSKEIQTPTLALPTEVESTQESIDLKAFPNPFADQTQIEFTLPTASDVTLEIFNLHGQRVQRLEKVKLDAGPHRYEWDGTSSKGASLPTGIYMLRLRADKRWFTTKVSLVHR